jgi:hypothetical protein
LVTKTSDPPLRWHWMALAVGKVLFEPLPPVT